MTRFWLPVMVLAATVGCGAALAPPVRAQGALIEETTPPPPKPAPKPKPVFVPPTLLWKVEVGRVEAAPQVQDATLYVGAADSLLQLDTLGRQQWRFATGPHLGAPTMDSQRVYIGSDRGTLFAVRRDNGDLAWQFTADQNAAILTQPSLGAGRIYFEATDNNVYALDALYGQLRWKFTRPDGSLGYSAPVFFEDALYVCGENAMYRLNAATGKQDWRTYIGGKSLSTPAIGDGRLYIGGDGTGLTALAPDTGSVVWTFNGKGTGDWFGPPQYADGTVYVSTYNRYVYAVDAKTGKPRWSYRVLGNALASPAVDTKRNVVYVTSITFRDNPTLTAIDAKTGKKLWDYRLGHTTGSPQIIGDRLYVGSTTGNLYAFSLK
ncbi:MAG: hypothetical protein OHK0029_32140 [Armatimonadaceae bacterium]